jgi:hypothetical protein
MVVVVVVGEDEEGVSKKSLFVFIVVERGCRGRGGVEDEGGGRGVRGFKCF